MIFTLGKRLTFIGLVLTFLGVLPTYAFAQSVFIQNPSFSGGVSPGDTITFQASASGFTSVVTFGISDTAGGTAATIDAGGNFKWKPVITDAGFHVFTITASDSDSHQATVVVNIQVINNAVLIQNLVPGQIVPAYKGVTFTASAPGYISPTYGVSDSYAGTSLANNNINATSGVFSWTPQFNEQGVHTITVFASDLYGHNGNIRQTITIIAPSVSVTASNPDSYIPAGTKVTFTAIPNDFTKPVFSVTDAFPGTTTIATTNINASGLFSWIPTTGDIGLHNLVINVSDSTGSAASTTKWIMVTTPSQTNYMTPPSVNVTPPVTSSTAPAPSSNGSVAKGDGYVFKTYLGIGSRGLAVTELQKRLIVAGVFSGNPSGYFGPVTAASVKKFQTAHGLAPLGYVGPGTRAALNAI